MPSSENEEPQWTAEVKQKILDLAEQNKITMEDFARIVFFLDQEGWESPYMNTLKLLQSTEAPFKTYLNRLSEDTKIGETDQNYKETMRQIYAQFVVEQNSMHDGGNCFTLPVDSSNIPERAMVQAFASMTPMAQRELAHTLMGSSGPVSLINTTSKTLAKFGKKTSGVLLAALYLSYDAIINLRRFWKGEITGKRCAKGIIDSVGSVIGGFAGSMLATAVAGPLGTVAGGFVGGFLGSTVASLLVDRLTREIFDLPLSEAAEAAYNFFGLNHKCSNSELNSAFRRKCLEHHPDKGGKKEDFMMVQCHFGSIKMERNEL